MAIDNPDNAKTLVDALSVATVVGTIMDILPAIAALLTIVWTLIRIWETKTVQRFFNNHE